MTEIGVMSFHHSSDVLEKDDRVSRTPFGDEPKHYGTVTEVYKSTPDGLGNTLTLFAVKWDQGYEQRGYLRQGLTREVRDVTPQS